MEQRRTRPRNNGAVVALCLTFVGGMTGMSFAAVPLYRLFCQVTGYNGTTKRVDQMSDVVLDRTMKVGFDANTSAGLPWDFKPVKREIALKIGETVQVEFTARNMSSDTTRGQAVFNVTPMAAAAYFNKVECFCFTETTLKPGETLSMPVVFFIDPDITRQVETKGIGNITLSYTFYEHTAPQPVALKTTDGPKENDRL